MSHNSSFIIGYGCASAAGQGASCLYEALLAGSDVSEQHGDARICRWRSIAGEGPQLERLSVQLLSAFHEACVNSGRSIRGAKRLGVIFASTKGAIEDVVWDSKHDPQALTDTLSPVLQRFLALADLQPARAICVSNACSSTHVALQLAQLWLGQDVVDTVLVLAADAAGPFVLRGFASLKSLAVHKVTPFGDKREGIQLGEAAVALVLSRNPQDADTMSPARLSGIDSRVEGYALTRSNESGASLREACRRALCDKAPEVIIAHGTGTPANDAMEELVYRDIGVNLPITASKWSVGHTLGASGGVDLVAALEMLRRREVFAIHNTETLDPSFTCAYLTRGKNLEIPDLKRVLVASAGFGGMHAAAVVERL